MNSSSCYSLVLCEGIYDRAFWAGWLRNNGWDKAEDHPDPYGKQHRKGAFSYLSSTMNMVVVKPCGGVKQIKSQLSTYVPQIHKSLNDEFTSTQYNTHHIIVSVDNDTRDDSGTPRMSTQALQDALRESLTELTSTPYTQITEPLVHNDQCSLFDGKCVVSVVRWEAESKLTQGIPAKQTLERLVCVAMCEAYPERAEVVEQWLTDKNPKSYAWAYMARWYAEHGCDDFYQGLWRDEKISERLKAHLTVSGAWAVFESLQG